jgi:NAD(P)-dependent dehydrogenase (short-subunit alcohol dehydrogenase family)
MIEDLKNKVVLITGASTGIGAAAAQAFGANGASVAVHYNKSKTEAEKVAAGVKKAGGKAILVGGDVTDSTVCKEIVEATVAEFGRIDVLINNAAIIRAVAFVEEDAERLYRTNLLAPVELTRQVLPGMLERGWGHVVHISSIAGKAMLPFASNYAASKAALVGHALSLRAELHGTGVSVSAVCPGFVRDEGMFVAYQARAPWYLLENEPSKVARAVVKVVEQDRAEVIVNRLPLRPVFALRNAAPDAVLAMFRLLGFGRFARALAAKEVAYSG